MLPSIDKGPRLLQYYMHDDPDAFRMELSGMLTLATADSVYHAWKTAQSTLGARPAVVDITFVDTADERGRDLLRFWHKHGARIIARSPESRVIAHDIPLEPEQIERSARGLSGRLKGLLRRLHPTQKKADCKICIQGVSPSR